MEGAAGILARREVAKNGHLALFQIERRTRRRQRGPGPSPRLPPSSPLSVLAGTSADRRAWHRWLADSPGRGYLDGVDGGRPGIDLCREEVSGWQRIRIYDLRWPNIG